MLKEFKAFVMKGNVLDMAAGVIIGLALGRVITSFVNDVLMPPIGLLLGNTDFSNLFAVLSGPREATLAATRAAGGVAISYGVFLNTAIDFVIVAFAVFMMVRLVNRYARTAPAVKKCEFCKSAIPEDAIRCPACTSQLKLAA